MTDTEKNEETSFCTVTRLMALADKAIGAQGQRLGHLAQDYRQALHDELMRLFTPLTHEQAKLLAMTYSNDPLNLIFQTEVIHGIGGES